MLFYLVLSYASFVLGYPITQSATTPFQQSSDAWAQVIANVAPLMALIGEKNAKEHMRTASSWHQFLPLATAPLGILSVLVSAIRLSGPGFLRRLVGRDGERRSEALVELTPLSVNPATSIYTPRAVEIEPLFNMDKVAFVCGHVRKADTTSALEGFRALFKQMSRLSTVDRDTEMSLAVWHSSLNLEQLADIVRSLQQTNVQELPPTFNREAMAALSYRTTGISPTQTAQTAGFWPKNPSQWQDVGVAVLFIFPCIGVQVLGLYKGSIASQTFWMGVIGYLAVVGFTVGLLLLVKSETVAECESLPSIFKDAYWTFSDERHAEHKPVDGPKSHTLVVARPLIRNPKKRLQRQIITTLLTLSLCTSYVLFYLSMRIAPWWVAFAILGVIWLGAFYRALNTRNFLVATDQDTGRNEHWIGMFRNTISESLVATLECAGQRPALRPASKEAPYSSDKTMGMVPGKHVIVDTKLVGESLEDNTNTFHTVFFLIPSLRMAMRTWSGAEDVMKVGLEMAKLLCKNKVANCQSRALPSDQWWMVVRFRMTIYVPGMVWQSLQSIDLGLIPEFKLAHLIRLVVKLLHVCLDHEGELSTHAISSATSAELSHVLCGPSADMQATFEPFCNGTITLRRVLQRLKDHPDCAQTRKFSLDQATLLPMATLASIYETFYKPEEPGSRIEALQKKHVDGLALSGQAYIDALKRELEVHGVVDRFLQDKDVEGPPTTASSGTPPEPRGASSGDYSKHNMRDSLRDAIRSARPGEQDGQFANKKLTESDRYHVVL